MRKYLLRLSALAILTLLVSAAGATSLDTIDQINVYGPPYSPSGAFQFYMTAPGDFTLHLGNTSSIITDKGSGTGLFATQKLQPVAIIQNGTTITGSQAGGCTNTSGSSCTFDLSQSGGPILFEYGKNGSLLTADLQLEQIVETNTTGGTVNNALFINLTNFSGQWAGDFANDGVLQLELLFNIQNPSKGTPIYSLVGEPAGRTIWASILSGQVNPVNAPDPPTTAEPASLAMLGVGLLSIGAFLRKKAAGR